MQKLNSALFDEELVQAWARGQITSVAQRISPLAKQRSEMVKIHMQKVLDAFHQEKVGVHHFASSWV